MNTRLMLSCLASVAICANAWSQIIDGAWTMTVNGQAVQVEPDGSFRIRNISSADRFGPGGPGTPPDFLGDDFIRVVGSRAIEGGTQWAYSGPFQIRRGETFSIQEMTVTNTAPPFPESLRVLAPASLLAVGESVQLAVLGTLLDSTEIDVTTRDTFTIYLSSNLDIATVGQDGLVTGVGPGAVVITALNEGATFVKQLTVSEQVLTTDVEGYVQLEDGTSIVGASIVTTFGGTATSGAGGFFRIDALAVPSEAETLTATATATIGGELFRASNTVELMAPGVTDAGLLTLRRVEAEFETEYGTNQGLDDDTFTLVPLAFVFPFFDVDRSAVYVGTNGYLTFGAGDSDFTESITEHLSPEPRISLFFDDLFPGIAGFDRNVYVNQLQSPNRLVVTWDRVPEFLNTGSNTLQVVLFESGRIQFGYAGMTAVDGIVGLSPGGIPPFVQVDFSTLEAGLSVAPGTAMLEQFLSSFDLDGGFVVFEPSGAGYDVSFVPPPPLGLALGAVHGRVVDLLGRAVPSSLVQLDSPSDSSFVRCDRTDEGGWYRVDGVPLGASIRARSLQDPNLFGAGVVAGDTRIDLYPGLDKED